MKLPEKIYLQKNTTTDLYEEVWPEWFETRSSDDDVEYIRADVLHNKIALKFNVGDYVVFNGKNVYQIIEIDIVSQRYECKNNMNESLSVPFSCDFTLRKWTIQDAKDRDVLVSGDVIFIFNKIHGVWVNCYCSWHKDGSFWKENEDLMHIKYAETVHPATNEQCELLFQKIKNAGYEWDTNEKKLKKIDKIEPKFNVKDWIANGGANPCYVKSIFGDYYELCSCEGFEYTKHIIDVNYIYHLWTIADANVGDVLVDEDNNIGLYSEEKDDLYWHSCIYLGCDGYIRGGSRIGGYHKYNNTKPATEEQRDMLFHNMKEAGFEWDAEKKELKKIEQKPVDKAEPKFHEGDWITDGYIHCKITEILDDRYIIESKYAKRSAILFEHENRYHLWTIKDAKDGDVLTTDNFIFIFKSIDNNNGVHYYCHYEISKHEDDSPQFGVALPQSLMGTVGSSFTHYKPATKEQHNLLFQKMKEAGYEWNSENKELKMKILFLDFDGVITTRASHWKIDFDKLALINYLCEKTGTKIVVTSSWRIGHNNDVSYFNESLTQYFNKNNYSYNFYPLFETFIKNIVGMTDSSGSCRGDEIKRWLDEHDDVDNYVILDDDSDMLDEQLLRFVQTDTYEGITDREVAICIDILNGIEVINPIRMNDELKFRWRLKCRYPDTVNNIKDMLEQYRNKFKH